MYSAHKPWLKRKSPDPHNARNALCALPRHELIATAISWGVKNPRVLSNAHIVERILERYAAEREADERRERAAAHEALLRKAADPCSTPFSLPPRSPADSPRPRDGSTPSELVKKRKGSFHLF